MKRAVETYELIEKNYNYKKNKIAALFILHTNFNKLCNKYRLKVCNLENIITVLEKESKQFFEKYNMKLD